jgi:hypothetical protein
MTKPSLFHVFLGSLIGGYIYLRFFNPVIVTPDALNITTIKPNRFQRRNLILIAKVLQNLSNGLLFGDKEVYMKVLNRYIQGTKQQTHLMWHVLLHLISFALLCRQNGSIAGLLRSADSS